MLLVQVVGGVDWDLVLALLAGYGVVGCSGTAGGGGQATGRADDGRLVYRQNAAGVSAATARHPETALQHARPLPGQPFVK